MTVGKKILLLTETATLRDQVIKDLSPLEMQFKQTQEVVKTIQTLTIEQYDLILIDGEAAGADTVELLKIIREKNIKIPSLLFTDVNNIKLKQEGLRLGVFDFIDKPIDTTKMLKTVKLGLERGKEFLEKSIPSFIERKLYTKIEIEVDKKTLSQLEKICEHTKISKETYIQKAIQKNMAREERTYDPSDFWSPQIITGVTWIDDQHYLLLMQIQEIYTLYYQNQTKEKLGDIFSFLNQYVDTHFQQEEQMFYVLDPSEKTEHLLQHKYFKDKMSELNSEIQSANNGEAVLQLALYCQRWFISHIRVIDQNLVFKMRQAAICS